MELNFDELRELLTLLNQTDVAELMLKSNEFELTLRKGNMAVGDRPGGGVVSQQASLAPPPSLPGAVPAPLPAPAPAPLAAPPPPAPAPAPPPPNAAVNDRLVDIISPMVGTFYRAPAPDEPPFVDTGDRIRPGQTVCIIEAMKLMNELEAEVSGEIVEILLKNGEPVEYGQVLMRVNPS
ncbi:acetyl-CoA carboxylase biotin carboxyl carrier protein [Oscillatoria sp. FACHB-1407]|uniref:acetyl-CoA carboxylase biotin carboxyl carrier protein n=1 Tax=Oscillatoria sp. FACHB-1407 TaxID=2692847 RepID=UPI0016899427|nr:acetyl-CoA carboxylase biotin carboxyl carrier protein [Oscillatoria sp. FACHB-1407]MBD2460706.1 acetyl-CoA carboxylase biotin carboxyl carrier protein [Oscillatoria sp. FACHB-1407]